MSVVFILTSVGRTFTCVMAWSGRISSPNWVYFSEDIYIALVVIVVELTVEFTILILLCCVRCSHCRNILEEEQHQANTVDSRKLISQWAATTDSKRVCMYAVLWMNFLHIKQIKWVCEANYRPFERNRELESCSRDSRTRGSRHSEGELLSLVR